MTIAFFTMDISFNEYHLIFPRIIIGALIILAVALLLQKGIQLLKRKEKRPKPFRFFSENYDAKKFYATLVLLVLYPPALSLFGFLPASILFMFLITILYAGQFNKKTIIVSISNSLASSIAVWYVFGQLFDITLP
ncbi:Tripartite tricarboxylate transporter TctB family protein [Marinococcus luteus]|jgi:putative tricarboxylic transport membrane protein|uniref:Tripartite tricarboxylate transporter TctB family protein n=1 Tax=Marinococcus luteus TaxID=1122204 RepID=A0A1H2QU68_9BACI|nr:tripartite tricarboxylate transporter TctB family protein [Marinococcus luteus]SDW10716.1 Tripartite tricarboxylate transporter TctB family protein [Marinococcus luteus]